MALFKPCLLAFVVLMPVGSVGSAQNESAEQVRAPASQRVDDKDRADADPIRNLLGDVRDHVFSFDHPAFYRIRELVATDDDLSKYRIEAGETPLPWRFLLERPSDYRGSLVLVEGLLLSKTSYRVPNRPDTGPYHECHLGQADTRAVCTVILAEDPASIPINAFVRTKGYFVFARSFENKAGEAGSGPLLVARRLDLKAPPAWGADPQSDSQPLRWIAGATACLAIAWLALRRFLQRFAAGRGSLPRFRGPEGDSPRDFDWLLDDSGRKDDEGR